MNDISNLKINKLTREQYVEARKNGQIDEQTEVYLVKPDDGKFASGVSTTKYEGEGEDINTIPQFRNSIVTSAVPSTDDLNSLAIGDMIYIKGESSGSGATYTLPKATKDTLGGVKVWPSSETWTMDNWATNDDYVPTMGAVYSLVDAMTCLIEGTPINMYDGTYKNIEAVEPGDLVLSYNPVTKKQTPAVVFKNLYTGADRNYQVYSFENGKALTVFGVHMIYNQQTGNVENIQNINETAEVITGTGETTHWTVTSPVSFAGRRRNRYHLITSNNLYFANDILLGTKGYTKLHICLDYNIALPDEIMKIWEQDAEDYNSYLANTLTNPDFHKEAATARKTFRQAVAQISSNKQKLNQTDYKTQKYVEGKLTEEDWYISNQQRDNYRLAINENEQLLESSRQELDKIRAKYRKHKTPEEIFNACCTRDNAIYELVKSYFENKNKIN